MRPSDSKSSFRCRVVRPAPNQIYPVIKITTRRCTCCGLSACSAAAPRAAPFDQFVFRRSGNKWPRTGTLAHPSFSLPFSDRSLHFALWSTEAKIWNGPALRQTHDSLVPQPPLIRCPPCQQRGISLLLLTAHGANIGFSPKQAKLHVHQPSEETSLAQQFAAKVLMMKLPVEGTMMSISDMTRGHLPSTPAGRKRDHLRQRTREHEN